MYKCDFNCDACSRSLCVLGNPTLEPNYEDLQDVAEKCEDEFRGVMLCKD